MNCQGDCIKCCMQQQAYCGAQLGLNNQNRLINIENLLSDLKNLLTKPKEEAQQDAGAENSASE